MTKSSRHINGNKEGLKQIKTGGKENECTVRYKSLRPLATSVWPEIPRRVRSGKGLTSFQVTLLGGGDDFITFILR